MEKEDSGRYHRMGDSGAAMHAMAMGGQQERDSALLGTVRRAGCAMGAGGIRGAAIQVIQRDVVLAGNGVAGSGCRYPDRVMLVVAAADGI